MHHPAWMGMIDALWLPAVGEPLENDRLAPQVPHHHRRRPRFPACIPRNLGTDKRTASDRIFRTTGQLHPSVAVGKTALSRPECRSRANVRPSCSYSSSLKKEGNRAAPLADFTAYDDKPAPVTQRIEMLLSRQVRQLDTYQLRFERRTAARATKSPPQTWS